MSALFLIAVDTLSKTAESGKTANDIFHLEMLLINHDAGHVLKFV